MGKFKGFLKRTLGCLTLAAAWAPAVLGIGGLAGLASSGISALVFSVQKGNFSDTAVYQQEYIKDVDEASQLHIAGELSDEEYYEKLQYIGSDDYKKEVKERPLENLENYDEADKKIATSGWWALGTGIACAVGAVSSLFWYFGDVYDDLDYAASDFFEEARIEDNDVKKKKKAEEEKEVKKDKKKDEFEETEVEDVLPNIEDSCYSE